MTVDVIERMKLIEVAEQEVQRRECELEAKVKRMAEAEKHRLETLSSANHQRALTEASGHAEAIALRGDAEAFAVETRAKARAEEMAMKADAWKEYQRAAKVSMWLEAIPSVAAEVAAPLSQVGGITMVRFPDGKESLGPARVTGEVMDIVEQIPNMVQQMTGRSVCVKK